jgi:hypothetical protein
MESRLQLGISKEFRQPGYTYNIHELIPDIFAITSHIPAHSSAGSIPFPMNSLMFSKIFPIQYKSCENIGDLCVLLH